MEELHRPSNQCRGADYHPLRLSQWLWSAPQAGPVAFEVASVKVSNAPDAAVLVTGGMGGMMNSANGKMLVPSAGGNVRITNWNPRYVHPRRL